MAIMSHDNCGLDYSPMNQMELSHVKKLATYQVTVMRLMFQINQKKVGINEKGTRGTGSQSMMNGVETGLLEYR
jgi:hypothetical protein